MKTITKLIYSTLAVVSLAIGALTANANPGDIFVSDPVFQDGVICKFTPDGKHGAFSLPAWKDLQGWRSTARGTSSPLTSRLISSPRRYTNLPLMERGALSLATWFLNRTTLSCWLLIARATSLCPTTKAIRSTNLPLMERKAFSLTTPQWIPQDSRLTVTTTYSWETIAALARYTNLLPMGRGASLLRASEIILGRSRWSLTALGICS